MKRTAMRPLSVRHWAGMLKGKARDRMVATFNIETLPTNNRSHFCTCKSYIYEWPSETPSKVNRELVVATAGYSNFQNLGPLTSPHVCPQL